MDLHGQLSILLILLVISSSLEVVVLASTQSYLHHLSTCETVFTIQDIHLKIFYLFPTPAHLWLAQDHVSAGAAFTALSIGSLGLVALFPQQQQQHLHKIELQHRQPETSELPHSQKLLKLFSVWTLLTIPSFLLTTGAHIFTLVLAIITSSSTFSLSSSSAIQNKHFELYQWTPETWFRALLQSLRFVHEAQREEMVWRVRVMEVGRWNLVVMSVLGVAVMWVGIGLLRAGRKKIVGMELGGWKDEKEMLTEEAEYAAVSCYRNRGVECGRG
ncbi:hypothetical protein LTS18_007512 [Coniosporium uncinatum]|uniref:Uncharacterized protein n=1 Tax=Coniosporium uncinatum TaxID=93489 RepID=A0ACC3D2T7_9PEZI|nr:hypothetical protein LTS18_007512 [Coniosporium uncinatum]